VDTISAFEICESPLPDRTIATLKEMGWWNLGHNPGIVVRFPRTIPLATNHFFKS
jgi:hypothetical protein